MFSAIGVHCDTLGRYLSILSPDSRKAISSVSSAWMVPAPETSGGVLFVSTVSPLASSVKAILLPSPLASIAVAAPEPL